MRRAAFLIPVAAILTASAAVADVYAPRVIERPPDIVVERRWWLETGPVFPDRQGTTGYWQTGFGLGGGFEFPVGQTASLFARLHSGLLPLRGTSMIGDTLSGESWTLYSLTFGAHSRLAPWKNSPSVRVLNAAEVGFASLRFGRIDERGPYSNGTQSARSEDGLLLGLGAGMEVAPEGAIGGFVEARVHWFSSGATYTWATVDAGVSFPW
jgi:hypothetical protein